MRFGYDGSGLSGWARQPKERTVEGLVRDGLVATGISRSLTRAHLEVASRTDRGVSARANALALSSSLTAPDLLRRLNAIAPELFFTAATAVPAGFRARAARARSYRYFEPGTATRPTLQRRAALLFRGRVDVRSFGREVPAERPVWRDVHRVGVERWSGGRRITVEAPSFVWGMVRKIVGALREVDAGRLPVERLDLAIRGHERLTLPMAEAEGLVLWEVRYPDVRWKTKWTGPNRHQARFESIRASGAWRRAVVVDALSPRRGRRRVGTNAS